jgi:7-cyano-7-deazaguanine synthase
MPVEEPRKAVVLLSGGLDSATALAVARREGFACHAMTFRYGQRHEIEVAAAERVAKALGVVEHVVVDIDLSKWGGSALTSDSIEVPKDRPDDGGIPPTYVPARNTVFLAFAVAWAEAIDARDVFIGVNAVDYSGYPDCRPEFIEAFAKCATLGTKAADEGWKFEIHAPLQYMSKGEIIELGVSLGVDYALTTSCYDPAPDGTPCGHCDSCRSRAAGFAAAGEEDPVRRHD